MKNGHRPKKSLRAILLHLLRNCPHAIPHLTIRRGFRRWARSALIVQSMILHAKAHLDMSENCHSAQRASVDRNRNLHAAARFHMIRSYYQGRWALVDRNKSPRRGESRRVAAY